MPRNASPTTLARQLLRLHAKPYNTHTCDADNERFALLALDLARVVITTPAAVLLGRKGGKVRSPAKTAAAQANGKKGGRPKDP